MKKFLTILILFFSIISFSIKIGYYENYPLCFNDNGKPSGIFVEIIDYIGKGNNIKINWIYDTFPNLLKKIKNNEIDIITSVSILNERKEFLNYPEQYITNEWSELISYKNIFKISDLNNKKIGVLKNDVCYIGNKGLKNIKDSFNIKMEFIEFTIFDNLLKALKDKKIDVGLIPQSIYKKNNFLNISPILMFPVNLTIASSKKDEHKNFLSLFDKTIKKLKKDKTSMYYITLQKYRNIFVKSNKIPTYLIFIFIFFIAVFLLIIFHFYKLKNTREFLKLKTIIDQIPLGILLHDKKNIYYQNKLFYNISKEKLDSLDTLLKKLNLNEEFKEKLFNTSNKNNELFQKINGIYYKIITIHLYSKNKDLSFTLFENLNELVKTEKKIMNKVDIDILEKVFDLMNSENYDYEIFIENLFKSILKKNIADFFGLGILDDQKLNLNIGMPDGRINKIKLIREEKTVSWFVLNKNTKLYIPNNLEWHEDDYSIKVADKSLVGKPSTLYICPIELKNTRGIVIFGKIGIDKYSEEDLHLLNILLKQISFAVNYRTLSKKFYEEKEHYKKMALFDTLTNLYTRYFFNGWILNHYEKLKRNNQTSTVVMIDVDNFKFINDKYGHIVGDEVLKSIAKVILNNIRSSDLASRFGGDEFIIVFDNFDFKQTKERMNLIQTKLSKLNFDFKITISCGISVITNEKDWLETLKEADKKMYKMKNSKK
ncbi:hypothetical protein OSSY52_02640 [Tepiditoga spiralis]|uniref:GGDEF domain-containing protein n=1 Tax=Tepiditoga spiralis TaxID=2108365 RepID=A0A7G1G5R3_9BACT|nr:GGDEF domain-containing protein [Tepiditoga spiralis]BBE30123.1 hypothetical protein OSSY52_02640 [Tepiditoga spiralis]